MCEPPFQGQPGPASPPAGVEIRQSKNTVLSAIPALSQANVSHRPGAESDMITSSDNLESALICETTHHSESSIPYYY